ncbi:hypothetical protein CDAR_468391 [Caerostris darwini]|uniref:Uncharacterized protein n=1 Tax=Caerostris darwini TaxID=1538125 RepID=A0AAV4WYT6_9ARAC|nr:hypothetical protein CDAR_468391 [Caerostris darwini]
MAVEREGRGGGGDRIFPGGIRPEDSGSRRIKSFPLDPYTRQRQITKDLGVLGHPLSRPGFSPSVPEPADNTQMCCVPLDGIFLRSHAIKGRDTEIRLG